MILGPPLEASAIMIDWPDPALFLAGRRFQNQESISSGIESTTTGVTVPVWRLVVHSVRRKKRDRECRCSFALIDLRKIRRRPQFFRREPGASPRLLNCTHARSAIPIRATELFRFSQASLDVDAIDIV